MRVEQQNQILEALQQAAGKDVKTASGIVAEKAKTTKSVSDRQTSIHSICLSYPALRGGAEQACVRQPEVKPPAAPSKE